MKKFLHKVLVIFLLGTLPLAVTANTSPKDQPEFTQMLASVMPSVVNISVQRNPPPFPTLKQSNKPLPKFMSIGSGVIIDAQNGYIITNAHVVKDAKNITITLKDSRKFTAKLLGTDPSSDIAVVQIKADRLKSIPFADSNKLPVGSSVAAIGSPFGLEQTVTSGIVSAVSRSNPQLGNFENYIQTDAPINMGNSGGALVNSQGFLVGINTAILAPDGGNIGIGFAIPSNTAKAISNQLIQYGNVKRGYMGVLVQTLTPDLADALDLPDKHGVLVSSVNKNSPAKQADIQVGDVITAVNEMPVDSSSQLITNVGVLRANSHIKLSLLRGKQIKTATVSLRSLPDLDIAKKEANPYFYGTSLRNYSEMNTNLGYIQGVRVLDVAEDSNASRDGLQPGDIIVSVNLKPVKTLSELMEQANKAQNQPLLLNILHKGGAVFIRLKPAVGNL